MRQNDVRSILYLNSPSSYQVPCSHQTRRTYLDVNGSNTITRHAPSSSCALTVSINVIAYKIAIAAWNCFIPDCFISDERSLEPRELLFFVSMQLDAVKSHSFGTKSQQKFYREGHSRSIHWTPDIEGAI